MTHHKDFVLSGMLGERITVRKVRGQLVITNRPRRQLLTPSAQQKATQTRFREASHYATRQTGQPDSLKLYQDGMTTKKNSAYLVAISDYFNAPKVGSIDAVRYKGVAGDAITVKATDDFMVTAVKVTISDASGKVIEEGDAGPDVTIINLWVYKATAANATLAGTTIRAIAFDRPGNTGAAEVKL